MPEDPLDEFREQRREASQDLQAILGVEEDAGLTLVQVETALRELREADEALARLSGTAKAEAEGRGVDVTSLRADISGLLGLLEGVERSIRRLRDEAQSAAPRAEARVDELEMMLGEREVTDRMRRDVEDEARFREEGPPEEDPFDERVRFDPDDEEDDDDVSGLGQLFG